MGPGSDGTDGSGTTGTVTAAKFQQDTVTLAKTFAGNATVIGFDLDNEPTAGSINWGQGGATDIQAMYTTVGNAIQAVDPGALIIAEGPQEYSAPGNNSGMNSNVTAPEARPDRRGGKAGRAECGKQSRLFRARIPQSDFPPSQSTPAPPTSSI